MAYGGGRGRNGDPFGVSRKQVAGSPIDTMLSCCNGATAESQPRLEARTSPSWASGQMEMPSISALSR